MAKTKIPDPLARRHLLEGETEKKQAAALAAAYLEAGREVEALDFLSRAEDSSAIQALQRAATERGDFFLMKAASAALKEDPTQAQWLELGGAAEAHGRLRDAESARRIAAAMGESTL